MCGLCTRDPQCRTWYKPNVLVKVGFGSGSNYTHQWLYKIYVAFSGYFTFVTGNKITTGIELWRYLCSGNWPATYDGIARARHVLRTDLKNELGRRHLLGSCKNKKKKKLLRFSQGIGIRLHYIYMETAASTFCLQYLRIIPKMAM